MESIGEVKTADVTMGVETWVLSAVSADGAERWSATGEDYYGTACALAELVGLELEDG